MGNHWFGDLKNDERLAAVYKNEKGCENQRKFRTARVAKSWKLMKREKFEIHEQEHSTETLGAFDVVPQVFKAQGGDDMAREGILNFLAKALKLPMKERAKYISVHPWTGRIELALPSRAWSEKEMHRYGMKSEWEGEVGQQDSLEAAGSQGKT